MAMTSMSTPLNGLQQQQQQQPTSVILLSGDAMVDVTDDSSFALSIHNGDDSNSGISDDEVRTLFVSGLPMDARPRELHLLFRAYKGYETSLLKISGKNGRTTTPVGFVTFSTRADAETAKEDLQCGVKFDPDLQQTLRLEFARSNTKMTKPRQLFPPLPTAVHAAMTPAAAYLHPFTTARFPDVWAFNTHQFVPASYADIGGSSLHQTANAFFHPAMAQTAQMQMPIHPAMLGGHPFGTMSMSSLPMGTSLGGAQCQSLHQPPVMSVHSPMMASPSATVTSVDGVFGGGQSPSGGCTGSLKSMSPAGPVDSHHHTMIDVFPTHLQVSPNSTLFVANVGNNTTENDLREIFGALPGFNRVRLHSKSGIPIAFVEYTDCRTATDALHRLQGARLSADHSGIRIEYARNKMIDLNSRKDVMIRLMTHETSRVY